MYRGRDGMVCGSGLPERWSGGLVGERGKGDNRRCLGSGKLVGRRSSGCGSFCVVGVYDGQSDDTYPEAVERLSSKGRGFDDENVWKAVKNNTQDSDSDRGSRCPTQR